MRARRQADRQNLIEAQRSIGDQQPQSPPQESIIPPQYPNLPIPPPLPVEASIPQHSERAPTIKLPHYKRAANTSRRCIFSGCLNGERFIVPNHVKDFLLRELMFYVLISARVCEYHLYSNEWELLSRNDDAVSDFTASQLENLVSVLKNQSSFLDFENVGAMPNYICHYWTGLIVEQFLELYNSIPPLATEFKDGKTVLAIYLTKIRTGDSNERLSNLFNMPRSTLEIKMSKCRECLVSILCLYI